MVHKTIGCDDSVTVFDNRTGFSLELNGLHFVEHTCPSWFKPYMDKLPLYVWDEAQTILEGLKRGLYAST
jgi:hypothetical protein